MKELNIPSNISNANNTSRDSSSIEDENRVNFNQDIVMRDESRDLRTMVMEVPPAIQVETQNIEHQVPSLNHDRSPILTIPNKLLRYNEII